MKIVIRVFEEKNLKESGDYKLIKKACKVITLADTKSLFDSPPLTKNVPVKDVSFDQIIPEKVPALKGINYSKLKNNGYEHMLIFLLRYLITTKISPTLKRS